MKPPTNPWRRFRASQGGAMLEWVTAGNIALIVEENRPTSFQNLRAYSLWAQTPRKLEAAAKACGFLAKRIDTDPRPHIVIPNAAVLRAAFRLCHHVPDRRHNRGITKR